MSDLLEIDETQAPIEFYGQRFTHHYAGAERQAVDVNSMSADFVIVTNQDNLHGNRHRLTETKLGKGLMTDRHKQNPVVLLEHGFSGIPFPAIGLSKDKQGKYTVKKSAKQATATVFFSQSNPDAATVFAMVDEGTLHMASIGFDATKGMLLEQRSQEELPDGVMDLQFGGRGVLFTETQLIEWSIVSQGADPGAMRQYLDRGGVNGEKLTDRMRAYLQAVAEPKRAWAPGIDLDESSDGWLSRNQVREKQSQSQPGIISVTIGDDMRIEGPREDVQAVLDSMERQSPLDTSSAGDTVSPSADGGDEGERTTESLPAVDLAGAFEQREASKDQTQMQEAFAKSLEAMIDRKLQGLTDNMKNLENELNRRIGVID